MKWISFFCLVVMFLFHATAGRADIIKLKRGVSFEGKVVEETDAGYMVELQVGTIEFKKEDIADVELYSEMQNVTMAKEWEDQELMAIDAAEADEEELVSEKTVLEPLSLTKVPTGEEDEEKLVKYKGRYITPEVYEIIQKEKEVRDRRYMYLQQQKAKKALEEKQKQPIIPNAFNEIPVLEHPAKKKDEAAVERKFGGRETVPYGLQSNSEDRQRSPYTSKVKKFSGTAYGSEYDSANTL